MRTLSATVIAGYAVLGAASATAQTSAPADPLRAYVPSTVSPEAAALYARYRPFVLTVDQQIARTRAEIEARYLAGEKAADAGNAPLTALGLTTAEQELGGVKVLEVLPRNYRDDGTALIYLHGGGFIYGSIHSSLRGAAIMAHVTGRRVFSVEYAVAPKGNWKIATDQVVAVYRALLAQGRKPASIGIFGESAGGNLTAAATLKLRDQGLPMPAGLILISPATDLTRAGDTYVTLAQADPVLPPGNVQPGFDLYADPADQKNPYVSPVYGDFSKGYPPTLIQGGTKEILISDMVRLHRAIRAAGGESRLELYEGMPHAFPGMMVMAGAPEGKAAMDEAAAFWRERLKGR